MQKVDKVFKNVLEYINTTYRPSSIEGIINKKRFPLFYVI